MRAFCMALILTASSRIRATSSDENSASVRQSRPERGDCFGGTSSICGITATAYATAASGTATLIAARTPPRKVSSAARTSVLVTVSGGANRRVAPPTRFTSKPSSRQCSKTDRASSGSLRSNPTSNPSPRTSAPGTRSASTSSAFFSTLPLNRTSSRNSSSSTTPSTALTAAIASGLPPKVEPWLPGPSAANGSLASTAPTGNPPPRPFALARTSGTTPIPWYAYRCPVRPAPVWTSSQTRTAPSRSHRSRRPCRKPSGATFTPPSPWIGSTKMAAGWGPGGGSAAPAGASRWVAQALQEALGGDVHAALSLDRLDEDGGGLGAGEAFRDLEVAVG